MTNIRRYYIPNSMVFLTTVTRNRNPIFHHIKNIELLRNTIEKVKELYQFDMFAYSFLPDHYHILIRLTENCQNFSKIMASIKGNFTANYKKAYYLDHRISLWQRRFWDHIIRDEKDLKIHMDYIHWNPVKHDLVCRPEDWASSSYMEWVQRGVYSIGWGVNDIPKGLKGLNYE